MKSERIDPNETQIRKNDERTISGKTPQTLDNTMPEVGVEPTRTVKPAGF